MFLPPALGRVDGGHLARPRIGPIRGNKVPHRLINSRPLRPGSIDFVQPRLKIRLNKVGQFLLRFLQRPFRGIEPFACIVHLACHAIPRPTEGQLGDFRQFKICSTPLRLRSNHTCLQDMQLRLLFLNFFERHEDFVFGDVGFSVANQLLELTGGFLGQHG